MDYIDQCMNLQLNSDQLLALYELVVSTSITTLDQEKRAIFNDIKIKLHDVMSDVLTKVQDSSNKEKFSFWAQKEQEKISQLNEDLLKLRKINIDRSEEPDDGLHFPVQK